MRALKTTPLPILVIAFLFLLLPILSYFATSEYYRIPIWNLGAVFKTMQPFQITILVVSIFVSLGILSRKKLGYFSFLGFSVVILLYNFWLLGSFYFGMKFQIAGQPITIEELWGNFFLSIFLLVSIFYFLNREISAPYFSPDSRGWRRYPRESIPLPFTLNVNGNSLSNQTINISNTGAMIPSQEDFPLEEGDEGEMEIEFENGEGKKIRESVPVMIVRINREDKSPGDKQIGIRFLKSVDSEKSLMELDNFLRERYAPRYHIPSKIFFGKDSNQEKEGKLGNISLQGMYIISQESLPIQETIYIRIPTLPPISLSGKVTWLNPNGEFDKEPGFGVHISENENPIRYRFWLFKARIRSLKTR